MFATRELEKKLGSDQARRKVLGDELGRRVYRRIRELAAAPSLDALRHAPGGCHELSGSRKGQLAVTVTRNYRLVFVPDEDPVPTREDGGLDWCGVTHVKIVEVCDYHE